MFQRSRMPPPFALAIAKTKACLLPQVIDSVDIASDFRDFFGRQGGLDVAPRSGDIPLRFYVDFDKARSTLSDGSHDQTDAGECIEVIDNCHGGRRIPVVDSFHRFGPGDNLDGVKL